MFRGLLFWYDTASGFFRAASFSGAVLGVQFLRLPGGQKLPSLKTAPQKPALFKDFDRFSGPQEYANINWNKK